MDPRIMVKSAVFEFFSQKGIIPGENESQQLLCDYIQSRLIDSFGIIQLVLDMEAKLEVRLDSNDLENPDFKTIGGLIDILSHKIQGYT